ncbi:hypothetical protein [Streptomyces albipurpureus]|uniref:Uncharacterized protein n=1 Tax=Streptomyces albipurpureus TaxID=2897419 RepID=A0ABT0USN0_9ACTN|nr:hypothetical protein [Streptomyces sp. CWNU-1]MCM2391251.1 hypothetical protein [Streptomyces sp. CWNU-1]
MRPASAPVALRTVRTLRVAPIVPAVELTGRSIPMNCTTVVASRMVPVPPTVSVVRVPLTVSVVRVPLTVSVVRVS